VRPGIEPLAASKKPLLKLSAELEAVAQLTSRRSRVIDYQKRLQRVAHLADELVIQLPPTAASLGPPTLSSSAVPFIQGIPDLPAQLVPNALIGWRSQMEAFVAKHAFDASVFVMIRYRERNSDLVKEIRGALAKRQYKAVLASDHSITDDLYNPVACLLCCSKGIAVFDEPEKDQVFNPNVAYELGMMHLLGRQCLALKHEALKALHSDILMKLYQPYATPSDAKACVASWIGELARQSGAVT